MSNKVKKKKDIQFFKFTKFLNAECGNLIQKDLMHRKIQELNE